MTIENATPQTPAAGSDDESGWSVESNSVGVPAGGTDSHQSHGLSAEFEEAGQTPPAEQDPENTPADDESAAAAAATGTPAAPATPAAAAGTAQPAAGGKKETFGQRIQRLKREADTETWRLNQARRDYADLQRQIEEAKKQVPAPGAAPAAAATGAGAAKPVEAAAPKAMPKHPTYRDFSTDAEYEAAVEKWNTVDMPAWQAEQAQAMEARITSGLESRLKSNDEASTQRADNDAFATRMAAEAEQHADWLEVVHHVADVQSSWYDEKYHGPTTRFGGSKTPFLSDLVRHNPEGPKVLRAFAELARDNKPAAQVLADLIPSKELRDALVMAPPSTIVPLIKHFASPEGAKAFGEMARMHPIVMFQTIGALSARLTAAPGGSAVPAKPTTAAQPSRTATAGTPGARGPATGAAPARPTDTFDDWMAQEDAKDEAARKRAAGIAV